MPYVPYLKGQVDVALLDREYKYVSTQNEMCIILQIVAFLVLGILGVIALILLPGGLRRRRSAAHGTRAC